jgi:CubicO group peptidase (beta-lactamase class C family)
VTFAFGSGQVYSTVTDLAKWDAALSGGAVLSAASRDKLFTANLSGYGYGWMMEQRGASSLEWHNGALSPLGFSSLLVRAPAGGRFVAYLANLDITVTSPLETKVRALVAKP